MQSSGGVAGCRIVDFFPKQLEGAVCDRPVTDSKEPFAVTHGIRLVADGIIGPSTSRRRTGEVWAIMIDDAYAHDTHVLTHAFSRSTSVMINPTHPEIVAWGATEQKGHRPAPLPAERNGYWFPMLLFGALILAAPLVYRPSILPSGIDSLAFAPLQQFGTVSEALGDPMSVALYWFCVVMFGPLITLGWYHARARRLGVVPQTGWQLLFSLASLLLYVVLYPVIEFATVMNLTRTGTAGMDPGVRQLTAVCSVSGFVAGLVLAAVAIAPRRHGVALSGTRWTLGGIGLVLAIASAAAIDMVAYLQPRNSYGALLFIAIGLITLSIVERGRVCAVIAVVFTGVALALNLFGIRMPNTMVSSNTPVSPNAPQFSAVHMAMSNLFLPAMILIAGGVVGLAGTALAGRRAR
jgi:hypothetical protein